MSLFRCIFMICVLLAADVAMAAPECYRNAALPAHVWGVSGSAPGDEAITFLTKDGKGCESVPLWKGKPLFRREMYVPLKDIYDAYDKARLKKDGKALIRINTWLRPTPRTLTEWLRLYKPESQPENAVAVGKILQTDFVKKDIKEMDGWDEFLKPAYIDVSWAYSRGMSWMWLFLHMGGKIIEGTRSFELSGYVNHEPAMRDISIMIQEILPGNLIHVEKIFKSNPWKADEYPARHITK